MTGIGIDAGPKKRKRSAREGEPDNGSIQSLGRGKGDVGMHLRHSPACTHMSRLLSSCL